MKTIFSSFGGALTLTEQSGVFTLSWNESLGGGQASGIISGKGSVVLNAETGLKLGEALLNAHLPASVQPYATIVETVANQAIAALE